MTKLACVGAIAGLGIVGLAIASSGVHAKVMEENFRLDTMRDLIALCDADKGDPNAIAAIHMCHGYVLGLTHFNILMGRALEGTVYCIKDAERPTRDQFVELLVTWSGNHPEHDSLEAIDGVLQWASDTYPCGE